MDQKLIEYPKNGSRNHKIDVYRFDTEILSGNMVKFDISNVISWELMTVKMTKDELRGLADFIYKYLENK